MEFCTLLVVEHCVLLMIWDVLNGVVLDEEVVSILLGAESWQLSPSVRVTFQAEPHTSNQNTVLSEWIDWIMTETLAKDMASTLEPNKHTVDVWTMPSVCIIYESKWVVNSTVLNSEPGTVKGGALISAVNQEK